MRTVGAGLVLLMMSGSGTLATTQPVGRGGGQQGPVALKQQLGLSDEQVAQLQKLRDDERKQAIRRRADIEIARIELREALAAPSADESLVTAKTKVLTDLQAGAVRARVEAQLALRKVLTKEQYTKLQQARPGPGRRMLRGAARGMGRGAGMPGRWRGAGRPGVSGEGTPAAPAQ